MKFQVENIPKMEGSTRLILQRNELISFFLIKYATFRNDRGNDCEKNPNTLTRLELRRTRY